MLRWRVKLRKYSRNQWFNIFLKPTPSIWITTTACMNNRTQKTIENRKRLRKAIIKGDGLTVLIHQKATVTSSGIMEKTRPPEHDAGETGLTLWVACLATQRLTTALSLG